MRNLRSSFRVSMFALAPLVADLSRAQQAKASDPIEGKWLGIAGLPQDRSDYGLDIRRDEKGALVAFLCSPVINFHALSIGPVAVDGDHYGIDGYGLKLTLDADVLSGTFGPLNVPVSMKRVATLPAEVPIPDVPRGPGPRLQVKLGAAIWAGVAAADGSAYVGTAGGVMHAVTVRDGSIAWTFNAGRPIHGEALATGGALYFTCDNGYLFKLDRRTGKEIWKYDLGDSRAPRILPHPSVYEYDYRSPRPVIADGTIYVGSGDGGCHAVKDESGERVWQFAASDRIRADALVLDENVVFGSFDGFVYALARATGALAWKKNSFAPITSSPAIAGAKLLIGNRGSMLYAMNPEDGVVLWRAPFWGSWVESTPVAAGDHLYVGSSDLRRVSCYDPKDGSIVWRTDVFGCPWARPLVTESSVYACVVGSDPYEIRHEGSLCALDRASGRLRWRWPCPKASGSFENGFTGAPAKSGDALVAGALDGTLYVFPLD